MPKQRWWSRTRGLPPEVHQDWLRSLQQEADRPARILAWAQTLGEQSGDPEAIFVIGSPAVLSWSTAAGDADDTWTHLGWHQIERGGWNAETRQLSWTQHGGRRGKLIIPEPARVPELFRERVAASIVVERFVPVRGERGVVVSGRRDLSGSGTISWHASLGRGVTWSTPGARETADLALLQLRTEYDPGFQPDDEAESEDEPGVRGW